jgi:hypothetical protein
LSHAFHVLDSETDALRPCTTRDRRRLPTVQPPTGGGFLPSSRRLDETFSCEQLIVDIEIVRWAKRVAAGFEFDDVTLGFDRRRLPAVQPPT